eukprot:CAMPEP_0177625614 /NCGR_PEP_ID=MMETSP0419_2-20121207/30200_1 /TAXON_ID=582737 /ORGANISM="Tetraselmis sp., Strain GSL018" /LENGTH=505 /DNA_ID=CAMNT_0019126585 /DNA_START=423 /DNA_END=1936 /DNA_ORIENTATION=-
MLVSTSTHTDGNAHDSTTSVYLTGNFIGEESDDIRDTSDFLDVRLAVIDVESESSVLEISFGQDDESLPMEFRYERDKYSWDYRKCRGPRVGDGFEGVALSPNGRQLAIAHESALLQDGPQPNYFRGSPTRLLLYDVFDNPLQLKLNRTVVYNVSQLVERPPVASASSSSSIKGLLWLDDSKLLVLENSFTGAASGLGGDGSDDGRSTSRVFLVDSASLSSATNVTGCPSLAKGCNYNAVRKRFIATLQELGAGGEFSVGGATWGPKLDDGRRLLMVVSDASRGQPGDRARLLAFAVEPDALSGELYNEPEIETDERRETIALLAGVAATAALLATLWALFLTFLNPIKTGASDPAGDAPDWWQRNRGVVMLSGAIYGYPAFELVLRSTGVYGGYCACGTFCALQQQWFGVISLAGFVANIAARPLWGYLLDSAGPCVVTDLGMLICTAGIALLFGGAEAPGALVAGWACLGFGGSSVHMANFHLQHLFPANRKPISATFTMTFS